MKLAIMQPYFLPYIGYFQLIKHSDQFVLLDDVQFIRHGWIERNRILKPNEGWQYIQIPLIKNEGRNTLIKNIQINNEIEWKNKILAQIQHYKKIAPYYFNVVKLIKDVFALDYSNIVQLNKVFLESICDYLSIKTPIKIFSDMNLEILEPNAPDEWALNICKSLGASKYWNPEGGLSFFDRHKYKDANIQIEFQKTNLVEYSQHRIGFIPGLSMLDLLMFNSIEEINIMLDNYELI